MVIEENRVLDRQSQGLGENPALLVVDVIRGFTDPACPLGSDADSVVSANRALMRVFHVQQACGTVTRVNMCSQKTIKTKHLFH